MKWLDSSTIRAFDFGEYFDNYHIEQTHNQKLANVDNLRPHAVIHYSQSRKVTNIEIAIDSLDIVLGLVGGLAAIIFSVL